MKKENERMRMSEMKECHLQAHQNPYFNDWLKSPCIRDTFMPNSPSILKKEVEINGKMITLFLPTYEPCELLDKHLIKEDFAIYDHVLYRNLHFQHLDHEDAVLPDDLVITIAYTLKSLLHRSQDAKITFPVLYGCTWEAVVKTRQGNISLFATTPVSLPHFTRENLEKDFSIMPKRIKEPLFQAFENILRHLTQDKKNTTNDIHIEYQLEPHRKEKLHATGSFLYQRKEIGQYHFEEDLTWECYPCRILLTAGSYTEEVWCKLTPFEKELLEPFSLQKLLSQARKLTHSTLLEEERELQDEFYKAAPFPTLPHCPLDTLHPEIINLEEWLATKIQSFVTPTEEIIPYSVGSFHQLHCFRNLYENLELQIHDFKITYLDTYYDVYEDTNKYYQRFDKFLVLEKSSNIHYFLHVIQWIAIASIGYINLPYMQYIPVAYKLSCVDTPYIKLSQSDISLMMSHFEVQEESLREISINKVKEDFEDFPITFQYRYPLTSTGVQEVSDIITFGKRGAIPFEISKGCSYHDCNYIDFYANNIQIGEYCCEVVSHSINFKNHTPAFLLNSYANEKTTFYELLDKQNSIYQFSYINNGNKAFFEYYNQV